MIGALAGAAIAKAGLGAVIASGLLTIAAFIVLSPLLGLVLGWTIGVGMTWLFRRATPAAGRLALPKRTTPLRRPL